MTVVAMWKSAISCGARPVSIAGALVQQIPLTSIGANLLIVPLVSFITVPLALLGSVMIWFSDLIGHGLLVLATASINLFWPILSRLGGFDFSVLTLTSRAYMALVSSIFGVSLLLLPRGLPARGLGLLWILPVFFPI